jgi:hypothetical protein
VFEDSTSLGSESFSYDLNLLGGTFLNSYSESLLLLGRLKLFRVEGAVSDIIYSDDEKDFAF